MTDSFVTQCPHCQTRFKVNHTQLSVARGVVRCGACLQVFNAARQLLEQSVQQREAADTTAHAHEPALTVITEPTPVLAAPPEIAVTPLETVEPPLPVVTTPVPEENYWHVSELDLDNLDLDEELARLEQREIQLAESFGPGPSEARTGETQLTARRDTPHNEQHEWMGSLTNDDVEQLPEARAEVISAHEPQTDDHAADPEPEPEHEARTEPSLSDNGPLDDDEADTPPLALDTRKSPKQNEDRLSARDDSDDENDLHDDDLHDNDAPHLVRTRNEPAIGERALLDLTDDPLQLDWQRPKPRWGRRLMWSVLVLLALGGLASQYIWYHFDHLARQDQYRPWFQQLCPLLDCKVPSKVDINQLKSSNLVVRSHPEFQGALVVDAIIYNRAAFSQPFPLLELRFADTSGQLIASRRFKPSEYLSGEMAGKEEMPPQTPIHIALDILDPGAKAVNYSLNFRSPE